MFHCHFLYQVCCSWQRKTWFGEWITVGQCHHLDTIVLPSIEFYQASATIQQVLATDQPKLLLCMVTKCKTICVFSTNKILKVLFDSGSTKNMIYCSALPNQHQCTMDLPPLLFQTLEGKATSTKAVQSSKITFPEFNSNISIDS